MRSRTQESVQETPSRRNEDEYAYLAVFGDIHGRIALMLTLAHAWQYYEQKPLHAILQVGDMGAYPDHSKLDRATLRHGKRDRDELSFQQFCSVTEESQRFLQPDGPDVFFIRGNHEDFDFLGQFDRLTAIDPFQRMYYIPDGEVVDLPIDWAWENREGRVICERTPLRVAGYGGVHPSGTERGRGKRARKEYRSARQRELAPKFFSPEKVRRAFANESSIDVLLTHAGPDLDALSDGSSVLTELSERLAPSFHFFGHHHVVVGPGDIHEPCRTVGLEHLDYIRSGWLQDASWGILEVHLPTKQLDFHFATHDRFHWMRDFQKLTYRSLWSSVIS